MNTLKIGPSTKSKMTHNVTKLPQVKDNKSHVKHILLYMCQICLKIFLTLGVPNTPQVKPTEDNCEAYFTQHVSNVTLCRCQIYSELCSVNRKRQNRHRTMSGSKIFFEHFCIHELYKNAISVESTFLKSLLFLHGGQYFTILKS
jgi:hypothetical protein